MSRVKQLSRNAMLAWSPWRGGTDDLWLVGGTSGAHLDGTFDTTASLDLARIDLTDGAHEITPNASVKVDHRFHSLNWSSFGRSEGNFPKGVIIGGCDNGSIEVYDANKLLQSNSSAKVASYSGHSGHVLCLDNNRFQPKLVASGASSSEVFIWDLTQGGKPMSPGPKQQPLDHVVSVKWSPKVEHILASLNTGKCVIWDLRKGDGPILTLADLGARVINGSMEMYGLESGIGHEFVSGFGRGQFPGHTNLGCQICRIAHFANGWGIIAMDWCSEDPDLLVTGGKDMKLYVWNPNTAQFLAEIPFNARNWPFQVVWCHGNPNLIGCASADSRVSVYSILGGSSTGSSEPSNASSAPSPKLAESFPGADFSSIPQQTAAMQQKQVETTNAPLKLSQVPKWLRAGPCGASFGFGGRLISFSPNAEPVDPNQPHANPSVSIQQVTTNAELVKRANELEEALNAGEALSDLCDRRSEECKSNEPEYLQWKFIGAHACGAGRREYAKSLGLDDEAISGQLNRILGNQDQWKIGAGSDDDNDLNEAESSVKSSPAKSRSPGSDSNGDVDQLAESLKSLDSLKADRSKVAAPLELNAGSENWDGLLTQAILAGDMESAVEICVRKGDWADAFQLGMAGGTEVFNRLQKHYVEEMLKCGKGSSRMVALLTGQRWHTLVQVVQLKNWRELLGLMLSFAASENFNDLCRMLIDRLQKEGKAGGEWNFAGLPAIASGNVEALVQSLTQDPSLNMDSPANILKIVEKVSAVRWSLGGGSSRVVKAGPEFTQIMVKYASFLAGQGAFTTAYSVLNSLPDEAVTKNQDLALLKDRLSEICGDRKTRGGRPFAITNVQPPRAQQHQQHQQQSRGQYGLKKDTHYARAQPTPAQPSYGMPSQPTYPGYNASQQPPPPMSTPQYNIPSSAAPQYATPTPQPQYSIPSQPPQQQPQYTIPTQPQPSAVPPPTSMMGPPPTAGIPSRSRYSSRSSVAPSEPVLYNTTISSAQQWQLPSAPATSAPGFGGQMGGDGRTPPPVAAVPPRPAAAGSGSFSPGWNDPPSMAPKKSATAKSSSTPVAPVTMPVAGGQAPPRPGMTMGGQQINGFQQQQQQQHQLAPSGMNNNNNNNYMQQHPYQHQQQQQTMMNNNNNVNQQSTQPAEPVQAAEPVELPPIPAENVKIEQVLENVAQICLSQPSQPLIKKRVSEAQHRFHNELYMRLRYGQGHPAGVSRITLHRHHSLLPIAISPGTCESLHQIVSCMEAGDYDGALNVHRMMASGYDFSTISSFMPSLKALIQTAKQMNVRI